MKTQYIQIRLSPSDRYRWESAANKQGITLSEFLRRAADDRAKKVERASHKEGRKK